MAIKVLHIFAPNYKFRFGGPIYDWKYAFTNWGIDEVVHFVLDSNQRKIIDAREAFDFPVSTNQYQIPRAKRLLWFFRLTEILQKEKENYDLIHIHILWWSTLLITVWARKNRIPTLYQSVLFGEDSPSGISIEILGKQKFWLLKQFSGIIALSSPIAEDYLHFGFNQEQVKTLMNPVNINLFRPVISNKEKQILREQYSLPDNEKIVLFVGSIIPRKGVDLLVNAFIKVSESCPNLFLLLVGPKNKGQNPSVDEIYIKELEKDLHESNLTSRVLFLGLISEHRVLADIYRACDVFTFPSRREGLGNVVLEAMSSGLPVITSDLPVLEKVIKDGVNGLVIPMEDSESLAQAIIKIYENEELAKELGNVARTYIEENHRFQVWQKELTGFYQRLHDQNGL